MRVLRFVCYDARLANEVTTRQLGHSDFHAKIIKGANPKQHEIEIAKILHKNGHEVLFTPENNFIQGIKNPEGILTDKNAVIEMKEITSKKLNKVSDNIEKAIEQNAEIVILNLVGEKDFAEKDAINVAKEQLYNSKKTLREIWLIYGEKISRIKR
ncbi:MAG: hypothetical protein P1P64_10140 [Treponemataceae bacterium]